MSPYQKMAGSNRRQTQKSQQPADNLNLHVGKWRESQKMTILVFCNFYLGFFKFYFYVCGRFCLHICAPHECSIHRDHKRASDPLELSYREL